MANNQKMNPLYAYFYTMYLELYLFGNALDLKRCESYIGAMDMPPEVKKLQYNAKHRAKYCEERAKELKKMYALKYTDGFTTTKKDYVTRMLYWEQFDLYKDECATANARLFAGRNDKANNIIIERRV